MCFGAGTCCPWKCSLFPNNYHCRITLPLWSQKYYFYQTNSVIIDWEFTQLQIHSEHLVKVLCSVWCFAGLRVSVLYHLHDLPFYQYQLRRSSSVLSKNIRMIHYLLSSKFLIDLFHNKPALDRIWRLIPMTSTRRHCGRSSGASPAPTCTSRRSPGRRSWG